MQDFLTFVIHHWELWLAFVIVLGYWLLTEYQEHSAGSALSAQQLVTRMNHENAVVIDLRESDSYAKEHILGALSFPEKDLFDQLHKIKKFQKKTVILVNQIGKISPSMIHRLNKEGFMQVSYLKNGMQAWHQANLPLEKRTS